MLVELERLDGRQGDCPLPGLASPEAQHEGVGGSGSVLLRVVMVARWRDNKSDLP